VACFSETVVKAEKLVAWVRSRYKGKKHALSFTAKDAEALRKSGKPDISAYAEGCDFFVYTTALGLGMNLTPQFDVQFMLADNGNTSAKTLAQLAGRPRNCVQPDLFIFIGQCRWRSTPGDSLDEMAMNKVRSQYQECLVPQIVNGCMQRTLPDTPYTVTRLQLARAEIIETEYMSKHECVRYWSDDTGNVPFFFTKPK
jgi:hypothetical protein